LGALTFLYGTAFTIMFTVLPRLGVVGNSAIMNVEPVFALVLAWALLGQRIAPVQVAGGLAKASSRYDEATSSLLFTLVDPATQQTLRVRYHGVKPANFEDAISIVAIGSYDRAADEFAAGKLLVKCPSKYQGAEVKTYS
ncbi:MAG TPA: cytochrome c maturation protein CcmE, partial [Thermoanaerobaculia bacterium]|nr:cytochrome c maturation protein CcmE [Thermoanaerobaculia bacterium]